MIIVLCTNYNTYVMVVNNVCFSLVFLSSRPIAETRVIMICCVAVSRKHVVPRQNDGNLLIIPPGSADTSMSHNGRVFVKYNDNEFYPLYFVYYKRRPEYLTKSKYYRANNRRVQSQLQLEYLLAAMDLSADYRE